MSDNVPYASTDIFYICAWKDWEISDFIKEIKSTFFVKTKKNHNLGSQQRFLCEVKDDAGVVAKI